MNISQYKNSMDEINVKRFSTEELLNKKNIKIRYEKMIKVTFAFILIGILALYNIFPSQNPKITITVYAAENEIPLTNNFVDCKADVKPVNGGTDNGNDGYLNSNIYFNCEGNDIKSITYTCSDQIVKRDDWKNASAYYVENMVVPINEYSDNIKDDNSIFGWYVPGGDTANVTKMIGNYYTVNYEEQNNIQYGLILAATVDDTGFLKINDAIIKIEIHFNDGSTQHKKIMIKSGKDAVSELQIRIL